MYWPRIRDGREHARLEWLKVLLYVLAFEAETLVRRTYDPRASWAYERGLADAAKRLAAWGVE